MMLKHRWANSACGQRQLPPPWHDNTREFLLLVVGLISGIVSGCAVTPVEQCSQQRLAAAAMAAVKDARLVEDFVAGYPACAGSEGSPADAYAAALASFCVPAQAWVSGRQGQELDSVCQSWENRSWREAYNLGRQLHGFQQQLQQLDRELAELANSDEATGRTGPLNLQRIKLVREIEAISGVAQVRGWDTQIQVD
jgi:hypothetical protein